MRDESWHFPPALATNKPRAKIQCGKWLVLGRGGNSNNELPCPLILLWATLNFDFASGVCSCSLLFSIFVFIFVFVVCLFCRRASRQEQKRSQDVRAFLNTLFQKGFPTCAKKYATKYKIYKLEPCLDMSVLFFKLA